jgi:glutaredoxin
MKRSHSLFPLLFLLCAASAHAQLFKWVGPDGKITYSDTPPPPSVKQVETKALGGGDSSGVDLPYEVAEAVKNNPVILYTTAKCIPCDEGRKMLTARGIPFAEKTVTSNDDIAHLRQIGGTTSMPLLIVGRNKQQGFEAGIWGAALTAASYPDTSKLPGTYRNPPPEAAVPLAKPVAGKPAGSEQPASRFGDVPPAIGNAPPGFRF